MISLIFLSGCTNIGIKLNEGNISEGIKNKAYNRVGVLYREKNLFDLKANAHKDPNLKGDLIRQEYFINLDF